MTAPTAEAAWHQALAFAVLGRRLPELGLQPRPDPGALSARLNADPGSGAIHDHVRTRLAAAQVWPHPVPPELSRGIGAAQFAAALRQLQEELGLDALIRQARVSRPLPLTAADQRLLREVPPHHGG
ncbi:hypothetical protein JOE57_001052 [Microlunatus panaciterrae]|uniref:Uncharacterized protein n=1 Tax=Microlunatus panaciterrae TaxID=400768 RepID=A0ABS2RGK4_9ACTN|nr:hypothetical protein [Microlunatus panaciterrae]MBM7798131.1 hypothetical protein [Microlunatus panaciterrae]